MFWRRSLRIGLSVLAVLAVAGLLAGLVLVAAPALGRGAWLAGYRAGRLSAGGEQDGMVAPVFPGYGGFHRGFAFGPLLCGLGLLLPLGLLVLLAVGGLFRARHWRARCAAGGPWGWGTFPHHPHGPVPPGWRGPRRSAPGQAGPAGWHGHFPHRPPCCAGWEQPGEQPSEEPAPPPQGVEQDTGGGGEQA